MKTYLVTGAAGFIGAAIAKRLIQAGNRVVSIDNMSTGFKKSVPDGVEMIEGGCEEPEIVKKISKNKFDCVMHVAGQSSGEISFDDPVYDLQTNTQSTLLLLKLCLEQGCKNFVYASSMSVYGEQESQPVSETAVVIPKTFYAVGKLASEQYMRIYSKLGLRATALRLFNVYGNGQNMGNLRQGMVSIFLAQAIKDHFIHVRGSSERFRDFVHVDDVVRAFLNASELEGKGYGHFNIGTGKKTEVGQLVRIIQETIPYDVDCKFEGNTPGDTFGIYADVAKAASGLNWEPEVTLKEGMKDMVEWAQSLTQ